MLDFVIRFSLRHRTLILLASVATLGYGGYLATTLPIDVFPDLDRPRVVILSECPGLASEEIETLVTQPIESAVLGATGVEAVRSQSSLGLSVIYVEFDWSSEIRAARQVVQERLATVMPIMPPGVRPVMTPPTSIMGQIMHIGVSRRAGPRGGTLAVLGTGDLVAERIESAAGPTIAVWRVVDRNDPAAWQAVPVERVEWQNAADSANTSQDPATRRASPSTPGDAVATVITRAGRWNVTFPGALRQQMELRTLADWIVRPRLLKVSGIAEILLLGGERKQYQVLVDPHALVEYDVSLTQVEQALAANNLSASGGFTAEGQAERPVRVIGRLGPLPQQVVADLAKVPVRTAGARSVLVEHVAQVTEAPPPKRGDASIDGRPGVVVTVVKQPHVDTRAVTARVHAALTDLESSLPADIVIDRQLFELENFIDRGIYYVVEALLIGALLVVIILVLFLLNVRTTFITLTAIPLSLAVTAIAFKWLGLFTGRTMSINVMTLGGLAVAMGELVDDAIVDVENIFRRLRENRALAAPRPALRVVFEASREIRSAIVFGTAVVILVFLPLFAMSGVEGRLFTPLGIAYIISIMASLLVSLTVTPVLSSYLLPQSRAVHREGDGPLLRGLKWLAGYLIRFSLRRSGTILVACWLGVAAAAWTMTRLGADFLPAFDEGSVQLNVALPAGSSLQASNDTAAIIDATLERMRASESNPNGPILHFVRRTGRDLRDEHAQPVTNSEYLLNMNPDSPLTRDEALHTLLDDLGRQLPGVDLEAEQPLAHLISHMLSGVTAQVAIKIFGDDLDGMQRIARQIESEIADVPGITDPVIESQSYVDELHIVLRADDLAFYGLSRAYVAGVVQTALQGEIVSQVLEGQRRFDLVVKLDDATRTDYSNLQNLRIDLPGGGRIALSQVADIPGGTVGPNQVSRENVRRRLVIRANARDRDLAGVVADIQARVRDRVTLPAGYFVEYGGQFESQRSATLLIGALTVLSVVGMFAVLMMLWPSPRIVLQILNAIPTAFVGGVLALVLTGQSLSVASLVGFVSLGGIAVRNGILLVSHYFHLLREEGEAFDQHMILRGSLERLAPVLMTALTAGIALLPIVLGGHKPGLEILYPVATVITGGLLTSTLCEFLVHPGLFWKFSGRDAVHLAQGEADVL
ncbi:MAG: efflux RND transporter permease subunit [Pirellulales bacterium]